MLSLHFTVFSAFKYFSLSLVLGILLDPGNKDFYFQTENICNQTVLVIQDN